MACRLFGAKPSSEPMVGSRYYIVYHSKILHVAQERQK